MDQLSLALAETHLRGSLIATLDLCAPWSIDFEQSVGIPVHYLIEGNAWLYDDVGNRSRITAGDLLAFPRWDNHVMSSSPSFPSQSLTISELLQSHNHRKWMQGEVFDQPLHMAIDGEGETCRFFSMVVELERSAADLFLLSLPRVLHISTGDDDMAPWLAPILQFLAAEGVQQNAGYAVVQSRLAELLFLQILRSQILLRPAATGALRALLDPAIRRVVTALKEDPGKRWTVAGMSRVAGLSRSSFAARFVEVVDMTPFEFLRGLRLDQAAERLKQGARVKSVIEDAGYQTPFSFTKAFRARFATTPGAYRASFNSDNA